MSRIFRANCKNVGGLRFAASPPEELVRIRNFCHLFTILNGAFHVLQEDLLPVCGAFSHNTCCNITNFQPVLL